MPSTPMVFTVTISAPILRMEELFMWQQKIIQEFSQFLHEKQKNGSWNIIKEHLQKGAINERKMTTY